MSRKVWLPVVAILAVMGTGGCSSTSSQGGSCAANIIVSSPAQAKAGQEVTLTVTMAKCNDFQPTVAEGAEISFRNGPTTESPAQKVGTWTPSADGLSGRATITVPVDAKPGDSRFDSHYAGGGILILG